MNSVDLHIHSSYSSDGEFSPAKIVEMARERGLSTISITDHNTIRGVKEAFESVDLAGIHLISGIEIDCMFQELNLHVLGYGIHIDAPAFLEIEKTAFKQEQYAFPYLIKKLQALGFNVQEDVVRKSTTAPIPAPEDIAKVILDADKNRSDHRLYPYRPGGTKSDMPYVHFFYDYCAKGRPAYIAKAYPDMQNVIEIIKDAGGIPVLAHPGASLSAPYRQLLDIISAGMEGIEVFSSYHDKTETQFFLKIADSHKLIVTRGSDFHGKNKPRITIGSTQRK